MAKFIEAANLPESEKVYLKKDFMGWHVVEPIKLDGKIVWKNVFNKKGFVSLIFILAVLGLVYLAYHEQIVNYKTIMDNPCPYCKDCQAQVRQMVSDLKNNKIDFGTINLTDEEPGG